MERYVTVINDCPAYSGDSAASPELSKFRRGMVVRVLRDDDPQFLKVAYEGMPVYISKAHTAPATQEDFTRHSEEQVKPMLDEIGVRYCTQCGVRISQDARFCGRCGSRVTAEQSERAPTAGVDNSLLPAATAGTDPASQPINIAGADIYLTPGETVYAHIPQLLVLTNRRIMALTLKEGGTRQFISFFIRDVDVMAWERQGPSGFLFLIALALSAGAIALLGTGMNQGSGGQVVGAFFVGLLAVLFFRLASSSGSSTLVLYVSGHPVMRLSATGIQSNAAVNFFVQHFAEFKMRAMRDF